MQETLIISEPSVIETELVKHNVTDATIAELRTKYLPLTISGIEDKKGYKEADEARKVCKNLRVLASKICKDGREDAIKVQKAWIAKEKEVTGQISEVEEHLVDEMQRIDDEKERIRLETERKEQERIQGRVELLIEHGCVFDGINFSMGDISLSSSDIKGHSDDIFNECLAQIITKHAELQAEAKRIEDERIAAEAEAKRIQEEEAAKLKSEREELERLRAEQERVRLEQEAKEREIRLKQEEIERQEQEAKAARIREEQEKKRQEELQKAREDAAEAARLKAIEDAKKAEAERLEAERLAQIENERQLALRPDKEKLQSFIEVLGALTVPDCSTEKAVLVCNDLRTMIGKMQQHIITKVKSL